MQYGEMTEFTILLEFMYEANIRNIFVGARRFHIEKGSTIRNRLIP